ncbi:MAG: AAA family ATPase [Polymorphobacter sp.]
MSDAPTRAIVEAVLRQHCGPHAAVIDGGIDAATSLIALSQPPELVLADISGCADGLARIEALAEQCSADTRVIVVGDANDIGLYRALMAAGVSDYLVKPLDRAALDRAVEAAMAEARARSGTARIVTFIGARGGIGTTTMAISAGWALAQLAQQRVVLLDLDLQFGTMALALDVAPGNGLRELLGAPDRIDATLIDAALVRPTGDASPGKRMAVLAAEVPLEAAVATNSAGVEALVAAISTSADTIIIELPRVLDAAARSLLRTADSVVIVTATDLAGLRDTQRLLRLVGGLRAGARPLVVASRTGRDGAGMLALDCFESALGSPVDLEIGEDASAARAAALKAQPLASGASTARYRAQWQHLANRIGAVAANAPAANGAASLFERIARLFGRRGT